MYKTTREMAPLYTMGSQYNIRGTKEWKIAKKRELARIEYRKKLAYAQIHGCFGTQDHHLCYSLHHSSVKDCIKHFIKGTPKLWLKRN